MAKYSDEFFYVESGLERYKTAAAHEALWKSRVLPINSDPTREDSDGDGLLDGISQEENGIKIAPKDQNPLYYDGPLNMWKNHIEQMKYDGHSNVATKYQILYQDAQSLEEILYTYMNELPMTYDAAHELISYAMFLKDWLKDNGDDIRPFLLCVKPFMSCSPSLGAYILNFDIDDKNQAYHAHPETWQKYFGYNDMYDDVFRIASYMHYGRVDFDVDDKTYALWAWKGDYWNLQSGAEVGIYRKSVTIHGTDHYDYAGFTVPMTLSLYNYYSSSNIISIYNWAPNEPQWWITGFDAYEYLPDPNKMAYIASIDLSEYKELFKTISNKGNRKISDDYIVDSNLLFDENTKTVWLQWYL